MEDVFRNKTFLSYVNVKFSFSAVGRGHEFIDYICKMTMFIYDFIVFFSEFIRFSMKNTTVVHKNVLFSYSNDSFTYGNNEILGGISQFSVTIH
jgi:hypothetical protein